MDLRELYRRFRAWQQNPFDYTNHSEHLVRCANCGTEFSDNFCPRCGQKAGVGPVNWQTVRQGLMMIWGMDSRSLSYSLLQLLLRPGYLISDYISGKRQVSFPPVKMLLIVAVGAMIVDYLCGKPLDNMEIDNGVKDVALMHLKIGLKLTLDGACWRHAVYSFSPLGSISDMHQNTANTHFPKDSLFRCL